MRDLEHRPEHLMLLLAFVASIFGVFELVLKFEERVFDVVEAIRWWFAVLCCADGRHVDLLSSRCVVCSLGNESCASGTSEEMIMSQK